MVVCLVYTCCVLPPRVAFGNGDAGLFFVIDAFVDGLFFIDVILSFQTGKNIDRPSFGICHDRICGEWYADNAKNGCLLSLSPNNVFSGYSLLHSL